MEDKGLVFFWLIVLMIGYGHGWIVVLITAALPWIILFEALVM